MSDKCQLCGSIHTSTACPTPFAKLIGAMPDLPDPSSATPGGAESGALPLEVMERVYEAYEGRGTTRPVVCDPIRLRKAATIAFAAGAAAERGKLKNLWSLLEDIQNRVVALVRDYDHTFDVEERLRRLRLVINEARAIEGDAK